MYYLGCLFNIILKIFLMNCENYLGIISTLSLWIVGWQSQLVEEKKLTLHFNSTIIFLSIMNSQSFMLL